MRFLGAAFTAFTIATEGLLKGRVADEGVAPRGDGAPFGNTHTTKTARHLRTSARINDATTRRLAGNAGKKGRSREHTHTHTNSSNQRGLRNTRPPAETESVLAAVLAAEAARRSGSG